MEKIVFIILCILLVPLYSTAQSNQTTTSSWSRFDTNKFWDNWFATFNFGGAIFLNKYDSKGDFCDRITPVFDLSAGKWLVPTIGVRLRVGGFRLKGFTTNPHNMYYNGTTDDPELYKQLWKDIHIEGDLLVNLSNWIGGHRKNRFFETVPYFGFGFIDSYNETNFEYILSIGSNNIFRLSKNFDANVDIRNGLVRGEFSGELKGHRINDILSVQLGITYNFNNKEFKQVISPINSMEYTSALAQIKQAEECIQRQKNINNNLDTQVKQLEDQLESARRTINKNSNTPIFTKHAVFFDFDDANISIREKINLQYIANIIKLCPDKHFIISGYADAATGNANANQKISQRRADNVKKYLINQGVDKKQLIAIGKGGVLTSSPEHFNLNTLNRVAIIEQETE